ncbi:hypothetical protein [Roseitranquillus sediminis]|uniref:hypothetical protein n=1 Tax=Roseitranquillus sediminis TaxID=2809051 RepID=UPI001D0C5BF7|nr:hypothetical protein [Roseitranquillus sediminis]MBM9593385.1 hypothetical protein [Roseitranquillus sediminis]
MDADLASLAREAVARLEHVLARGSDVTHRDARAATLSVIDVRDRVLSYHRDGRATDGCLDRANSMLSMAYGAEFPLSGLHRRRFEQVRDGMRALIDE